MLLERPDQWQRQALVELVTWSEDGIFCASRQTGKTEIATLVAYMVGVLGGFVLIVSPSDRQSLEFMTILQNHHHRLQLAQVSGEPTMHEVKFANGGRIIALPNSPLKIRVFRKVNLLIIEEAAFVPDAIYNAIRPMLMVSKGMGMTAQTLLLSSPFGRRGFFYQEWIGDGSPEHPHGGDWPRHRVSWRDCPRITPQEIEKERRRPGVIVKQEYLDCEQGEEFMIDQECFFDMRGWEGLLSNVQQVDDWGNE